VGRLQRGGRWVLSKDLSGEKRRERRELFGKRVHSHEGGGLDGAGSVS